MSGVRAGATLRELPSIQEVDRHLASHGLPSGPLVREAVCAILERCREELRAGLEQAPRTRTEILERITQALARPPKEALQQVINATGVVLHTNLGRAPLPAELLQRSQPLLERYVNLELDLHSGARGARGARAMAWLSRLAGSEAALMVNNGAAAVQLMLSALAAGQEVILSRGELVEIGGGFRIPQILALSTARLVEVGTTNRTRLEDYAAAITPRTAAILCVHRSNFHQTGFVAQVPLPKLAALARERGIPLWYDLGSGTFHRFRQAALRSLPSIAKIVAQGPALCSFSADKLLGSVQAGLIVGAAGAIGRMRRHPLYRSVRVDRVRWILLEATFAQYLEGRGKDLPIIAMLEREIHDMEPLCADLLQRLQAVCRKGLQCEVQQEFGFAGGGSTPETLLPTLCLSVRSPRHSPNAILNALRAHAPPILARLAKERVLLDFRTLFPDDLPRIADALAALADGNASEGAKGNDPL